MGWLELAELPRAANEAILGEDVTYTAPGGGTPTAIRGVFESAYVRQDLIDGVVVTSVGPALGVSLDALPGGQALRDAAVVVRGTSYTVSDIELDGQGGARLRLHLV